MPYSRVQQSSAPSVRTTTFIAAQPTRRKPAVQVHHRYPPLQPGRCWQDAGEDGALRVLLCVPAQPSNIFTMIASASRGLNPPLGEGTFGSFKDLFRARNADMLFLY
jgi:hypothetical protein